MCILGKESEKMEKQEESESENSSRVAFSMPLFSRDNV